MNFMTPEHRAKMKSPEMVAKRLATLKASREAGVKNGRKMGTPDGWTYKDFLRHKKRLQPKIDKAVANMAEHKEFEPDNKEAAAAIRFLVETVMVAAGPLNERNKAAATLLTFTQRKPVTTSETTLKTAEDFLDEISQ